MEFDLKTWQEFCELSEEERQLAMGLLPPTEARAVRQRFQPRPYGRRLMAGRKPAKKRTMPPVTYYRLAPAEEGQLVTWGLERLREFLDGRK
jgi:hypothetical protein